MDLGCFDMGCIETEIKDASPEKESSSSSSSSDSVMATSKIGKHNKEVKESGQSNWNALNKCTSQIRKPPHRRTSPLNWFPRKKVDSYLKRKIKLLQEEDGLNSTLDETLGDSNPHYSRVLKEKIAVKEAASKAIEARKAAMVEASWCRILKAARIDCRGAEAHLAEAEKTAAEAFEAATAFGVTMYDIKDCPQKRFKIETADTKGRGSSTHTVSASFETAFEVDKQVAFAVKLALTKLANCPSIKKDEFRQLLRRISENPDSDETFQDLREFSSECESDTGSDFEKEESGMRQREFKKREVSQRFNMTNLEEMMLERLKGLQEDELASLATIVATCGLGAALAEVESYKKHNFVNTDHGSHLHAGSRLSIYGTGSGRKPTSDEQTRKKLAETELPSLDKFLVKRLTRLEKEVLESKNARMDEEAKELTKKKLDAKSDGDGLCSFDDTSSDHNNPDFDKYHQSISPMIEQEIGQARNKSGEMFNEDHQNSDKDTTSISDLGTILVKHSSQLQREIEEARRNESRSQMNTKKADRICAGKQDVTELPSLDKFLVKHMSRLEREVQEAKNRRNFEPLKRGEISERKARNFTSSGVAEETLSCSERDDNIDLNEIVLKEDNQRSTKAGQELSREGECSAMEQVVNCHDILVAEPDNVGQVEDTVEKVPLRSHRHIQKQDMRNGWDGMTDLEGLDKVLVKHVSRLEREKMEFNAKEEEAMRVKRKDTKELNKADGQEGSLDQVLVKHMSRLEREKMSAAAEQSDDHIRHSVALRESRQKEQQEAWGGMSLGNSMLPHISRLQKDKAAAQQSEKEEPATNGTRKNTNKESDKDGGQESSLDQVLVKHTSRLQREKMAATAQQSEDHTTHSVTRQEARQKELQEAWGGMSLGCSMRPHLSRLQRDKAAWLKAEEDERRKAVETS